MKVFDGQVIRAGGIIVRQRGTHWIERFNVGRGRDFTLYSLIDGVVKFESGGRISVYPPKAKTEAKPAAASTSAQQQQQQQQPTPTPTPAGAGSR